MPQTPAEMVFWRVAKPLFINDVTVKIWIEPWAAFKREVEPSKMM